MLKEQAREIAGKLGKERLAARTVQVKVRYSDFKTLTRQTSVEEPFESAETIYAIACAILRRERVVDRPLRLIGLGVSGLVPPSAQMVFDFDGVQKHPEPAQGVAFGAAGRSIAINSETVANL